MPSHCGAVGRSLRKAVARATVHRGYRAVSGIATLAFAPFSRQANTAQFPSPLTVPAISPTNITAALRPDSVVAFHMKGTKIRNPAVTPDNHGASRYSVGSKLHEQTIDSPQHNGEAGVHHPVDHEFLKSKGLRLPTR